jgi:hypothetical protein
MKFTKVTCLFCEKPLRKAAAKSHDCPEKKASERRLGTKLATYDPVTP